MLNVDKVNEFRRRVNHALHKSGGDKEGQYYLRADYSPAQLDELVAVSETLAERLAAHHNDGTHGCETCDMASKKREKDPVKPEDEIPGEADEEADGDQGVGDSPEPDDVDADQVLIDSPPDAVASTD